MTLNDNNQNNRREPTPEEQQAIDAQVKNFWGVVGGAIYVGAFIVLWIKFGWEIPGLVTCMIYGNNLKQLNSK